MNKKPRIALVLGSGGARGYAHIGVLEALIEADLKPDAIAGCSIGSLVGGVYASGHLDGLSKLARAFNTRDLMYYFIEFNFPRSGLIDGAKIVKLVRQYVTSSDVRDLPVPFTAVATDILTGEEVLLDRGDLTQVIRASISIPGIFTPVESGGRFLVDGGLTNPVPVSVARTMKADTVVAVNLNRDLLQTRARNGGAVESRKERGEEEDDDSRSSLRKALERRMKSLDLTTLTPSLSWFSKSGPPNIFDVLGNSIRMFEARISDVRLASEPPDVLIEPALGHLHFMDFHRAAEAIEVGREACRRAIPEIRKRCGR